MSIFLPNLRADDIEVDTPGQAKKLSEKYTVLVKDNDTEYYQCQIVIIDFPSIRSEIGIQSVQLLTYEPNGKISTQLRVQSSPPLQPPTRPGEKLPELADDSRDRTYLCIPKEQIKRSRIVITYGYPNAMCYRDRIELHLAAFLTDSSLE